MALPKKTICMNTLYILIASIANCTTALSIPVIFENDKILAVNKPPNVSHHNEDDELGIVNLVRQQLGPEKQRIYGVHRLDRVTSGILLFAKSRESAVELSRLFRDSEVEKYYVALSKNKPKRKKQGWVTGGMKRGRRKSWMLTDTSTNFAKTRFFTSGLGNLQGDPKTLLLFRPYTGRTHQLRVAAKAISLPILGDPIYEKKNSSRTYLHASGLCIRQLKLCLWCPPEFAEELWEDPSDQDGYHQSLLRLMQKHCEAPELVSMLNARHVTGKT